MQNIPTQPQVNVPFSQTTALECENCGSELFQEVLMVRKISKILIGAPQDMLQPLAIFACVKCHHVNEDLKPKQENQ